MTTSTCVCKEIECCAVCALHVPTPPPPITAFMLVLSYFSGKTSQMRNNISNKQTTACTSHLYIIHSFRSFQFASNIRSFIHQLNFGDVLLLLLQQPTHTNHPVHVFSKMRTVYQSSTEFSHRAACKIYINIS